MNRRSPTPSQSSTASSNFTGGNTNEELCNCTTPKVPHIFTSWTNANSGRRFHACRNYKRGGYDYFGWADSQMCERSKPIIPGLLRGKNQLEQEVVKLKNKYLKLKGGGDVVLKKGKEIPLKFLLG
ncbi:hypothetical protein BUALT_Bualt12G0066400 [Buddleja alternifolia]|uniref:GRF-type domain-containing protein n=1 Tax=Buddleja alternifolia TaxID=168488 RepID=A0AAV6WU08_9LAMI|nr:hypothetical protein BUALT_Bualt12G0066400 [Buddleja alternifolia]